MRKIYVLFITTLIVLMCTACGNQQKESGNSIEISSSSVEMLVPPYGATDCEGKDQADVESDFLSAGFTNIATKTIEDLKFNEADKIGSVVSVSINGKADFTQGQEFDNNAKVVISYHVFKKCTITMQIDFVQNLLFSKYDVVLNMDGISQGTLKHGEDKEFEFTVDPGEHNFIFQKDGESDINGSAVLDVKGDTDVSLKISCHNDKVDVETVYHVDMGAIGEDEALFPENCIDYADKNYEEYSEALENAGFTNVTLEPIYDIASEDPGAGKIEKVTIDGADEFNRGDIFKKNAAILIRYHAKEEDDPVRQEQAAAEAALEAVFPKEMARRAVIVAMTNSQATDVFQDDRSTYDPAKFHSYSDIEGDYMILDTDGTWSVLDENTWHVEDIILRIAGYDTYLKATCNVKMNEDDYVVFNVTRKIASKEYLDSTDPNKGNTEHFEPEYEAALNVDGELIREDRDILAAQNKIDAEDERQAWISSQFNIWDGRHKELCELIKETLNDSGSFKPSAADYTDVYDDTMQEYINQILENAGFSERVDVGDVFIIQEFTAKNIFNATVKCTAYGIAHWSNKEVVLLGIE